MRIWAIYPKNKTAARVGHPKAQRLPYPVFGLQKPIILVVEVLIVNCPKLRTLETCMIQDLRVNGVLFQEISYAVQHLTMQRGRNVTVI
jgi:hypothetical protein